MRVALGLGVLGVAMLLTQSCALPYYAQAVRGQVELLRKRTPIDDIIARSDGDPKLVSQLEQIQRIRDFASSDLGLPDNASYRSYADLERHFVVWNVVATKEFSVEPERWCFLFVGCLTYRGFFKQPAAERFAARLDTRGLDTFVGGVTAYSTLGYFADPVLNTMLARGEAYVAGVIFHELAHQRLYVKNDSAFSEAFATVIEEYGTERWLATRADSDELRQYRQRLARRDDFAALIAATQERLRALYAAPLDEAGMRRAKAETFALLDREYAALRESWSGANEYDAWFAASLNNAHLAAVATYRRWVPALKHRLLTSGDIQVFYREAEALADLDVAQRVERLETWRAAAQAPPLRATSDSSLFGG